MGIGRERELRASWRSSRDEKKRQRNGNRYRFRALTMWRIYICTLHPDHIHAYIHRYSRDTTRRRHVCSTWLCYKDRYFVSIIFLQACGNKTHFQDMYFRWRRVDHLYPKRCELLKLFHPRSPLCVTDLMILEVSFHLE